MANKWRTAIANGLWVKEVYNDDPQNPSAKILVRAIYGIARTHTESIIDTLNATKSYTDPYVNGAIVSGSFRVIKNESRPASGQNLEGSDVIIQTLGQGFFTTLSASNKFVVKHNYEVEEQNENAWMYYARGTVIETSRWMNIASTSIAGLYPYTSSVAFDVAIDGYDTPVILENWYEREQDGSYSMYRTLFARSTTSEVKYRTIQYAGMILTDADTPPAELDTTIKLSGFRNETETIYANSKFSIGGDTYRITANATAVAGVVTVSVVPEVTLSTETYCEDNAMQVYFEAVS
jgi:hypothetical protein